MSQKTELLISIYLLFFIPTAASYHAGGFDVCTKDPDEDSKDEYDEKKVEREKLVYYKDSDGDKYTNRHYCNNNGHEITQTTNEYNFEKVFKGTSDCKPDNPDRNPSTSWYQDEDEDGIVNPHESEFEFQCERPGDKWLLYSAKGGIKDNCPNKQNPDQKNKDKDKKGDKCDSDLDGDGIQNSEDNCEAKSNADQNNYDNDDKGSKCDDDKDGDGVTNSADSCKKTAPRANVDKNGCEIHKSGGSNKNSCIGQIEDVAEREGSCTPEDGGKISPSVSTVVLVCPDDQNRYSVQSNCAEDLMNDKNWKGCGYWYFDPDKDRYWNEEAGYICGTPEGGNKDWIFGPTSSIIDKDHCPDNGGAHQESQCGSSEGSGDTGPDEGDGTKTNPGDGSDGSSNPDSGGGDNDDPSSGSDGDGGADCNEGYIDTWYKDADGDNYWRDYTYKCSNLDPGSSWSTDKGKGGGDCNDNSANINPSTTWYKDVDGDGYRDSNHQLQKNQCQDPGSKWYTSAQLKGKDDCAPKNANKHSQCDEDNDGVYDNSDNCPDVKNSNQQDKDGDGSGYMCDSSYKCGEVKNLGVVKSQDNNRDGKIAWEELLGSVYVDYKWDIISRPRILKILAAQRSECSIPTSDDRPEINGFQHTDKGGGTYEFSVPESKISYSSNVNNLKFRWNFTPSSSNGNMWESQKRNPTFTFSSKGFHVIALNVIETDESSKRNEFNTTVKNITITNTGGNNPGGGGGGGDPASTETVCGQPNPPKDLNGDGKYEDVSGEGSKNSRDILLLAQVVSGSCTYSKYINRLDFNSNGAKDQKDVVKLAEIVSSIQCSNLQGKSSVKRYNEDGNNKIQSQEVIQAYQDWFNSQISVSVFTEISNAYLKSCQVSSSSPTGGNTSGTTTVNIDGQLWEVVTLSSSVNTQKFSSAGCGANSRDPAAAFRPKTSEQGMKFVPLTSGNTLSSGTWAVKADQTCSVDLPTKSPESDTGDVNIDGWKILTLNSEIDAGKFSSAGCGAGSSNPALAFTEEQSTGKLKTTPLVSGNKLPAGTHLISADNSCTISLPTISNNITAQEWCNQNRNAEAQVTGCREPKNKIDYGGEDYLAKNNPKIRNACGTGKAFYCTK